MKRKLIEVTLSSFPLSTEEANDLLEFISAETISAESAIDWIKRKCTKAQTGEEGFETAIDAIFLYLKKDYLIGQIAEFVENQTAGKKESK